MKNLANKLLEVLSIKPAKVSIQGKSPERNEELKRKAILKRERKATKRLCDHATSTLCNLCLSVDDMHLANDSQKKAFQAHQELHWRIDALMTT